MYSFEYNQEKESFTINGDINILFTNGNIRSFFNTFTILNKDEHSLALFIDSSSLVKDLEEIELFLKRITYSTV